MEYIKLNGILIKNAQKVGGCPSTKLRNLIRHTSIKLSTSAQQNCPFNPIYIQLR